MALKLTDKFVDFLNSDKFDGLANSIMSLADAAVGGFSDFVNVLLPTLIDAFKWMIQNKEVVLVALAGITASIIAFNIAASANPLGAIVLAISAAVTAIIWLVTNWDTASAWIMDKLQAVANFFVGIWNTIKDLFIGIWNAIRDFFVGIWTGITDWITTQLNNFVAFWKGVWDGIAGFFTNVWNGIVSFFTSIPGNFQKTMESIGTAIWNGIQVIGRFFADLPRNIGLALGEAIGTLLRWGIDFFNWCITAIPQGIQQVGAFFQQLPGNIWNWIVEGLTNWANFWAQMFTSGVQSAGNMFNAIGDWFQKLPQNIWNWIVQGITNLANWGTQMMQAGQTAAGNIINSIGDFFKNLPQNIWDWIVGAVQKIVDWAASMVTSATTEVPKIISNILGFFQALPGDIYNVGADIIKGLWNGIQSMADWVWQQISGFIGGIVDGIKKGLGIHSPSTVFADIGKNMALGIGVGFADNMKSVVKSMTASIPTSFDTGVQVNTAIEAARGITQTDSWINTGNGASSAQGGAQAPTFIQQNTYNSPKALSPAEAARQTRNATKQLILTLQKG